jgi:hypothetical protein
VYIVLSAAVIAMLIVGLMVLRITVETVWVVTSTVSTAGYAMPVGFGYCNFDHYPRRFFSITFLRKPESPVCGYCRSSVAERGKVSAATQGHSRLQRVQQGEPHLFNRGMRHTSTALYFYGVSKKTLHKPSVTFGNMVLSTTFMLTVFI